MGAPLSVLNQIPLRNIVTLNGPFDGFMAIASLQNVVSVIIFHKRSCSHVIKARAYFMGCSNDNSIDP